MLMPGGVLVNKSVFQLLRHRQKRFNGRHGRRAQPVLPDCEGTGSSRPRWTPLILRELMADARKFDWLTPLAARQFASWKGNGGSGRRFVLPDIGLERLFRDVQGARFHRPQLRFSGRLALGLDVEE
jgi:hypothetical protein